MPKEVKPIEVENPFEAFQFLDEPNKAAAKVKEPKEPKEEKSGDISAEAEAALEKAAKEAKELADKRSKKKTEEVEEVEDVTPVVEEPSTEEEEEDDDDSEFSVFGKILYDADVIQVEKEEDLKNIKSEQDLVELVNTRIKNGIKEDRASKHEDAQKFLEFIDNGGDPKTFHEIYYGSGSFEEFEIDTEENQKHVIRESLKLEDYSDEDIEDYIKDAEDLGKLDKKAEPHLKKLRKYEKEQKKVLLEAQKAYADDQRRKQEQAIEDFKKGLYDSDSIGGFKLSKKEKDSIWEYMMRPVDRKTGLTKYQIDSEKKKDARYLLAYLMMKDYNIESLEKQVETKQVSKLKSKLSNYSDSRQKLKSGVASKNEVSEHNDFSKWKEILNS